VLLTPVHKVFRALFEKRVAFEVDEIPIVLENLPLKKIVNWVLTEVSAFFKPSRPWGFPTILQIEPSSHCNLQCPFCPVSSGMGRLAGHMKFELFKKIIDQVGEYLLLILFWDWGEPFLNPNAYEMIRYAREKGIRVISSTNGHAFASGDHARKVVESGLDVLVFSVDGISEESYRHYRNNGKLEAVLEGIRRVVAAKGRINSHRPVVNFRYIVMRHNEKDIGLLKGFARSLGVDVLILRKYHAAHGGRQSTVGWKSEFLPSEMQYRLPEFSDEDGRPVRVNRNPCRNLWNCPTIHWNGTVCSCFVDSSEEYPLGSLACQPFADIWSGPAFQSLRRGFRRRWRELPLCGDCTYGFKGGDIGRESNAGVEWLKKQVETHKDGFSNA